MQGGARDMRVDSILVQCSSWHRIEKENGCPFVVRQLLDETEEDLVDAVLIRGLMIQRLTLEFTAVIEKSCRHVRMGPQERPPLQQSRGAKGLQDQSVSPQFAHIFLFSEMAKLFFKQNHVSWNSS
ncbi:hypothetical protein KOW79_016221 [Hemibagrus wyckioides]|uniref:Uncharacterized protein n=1 Tax=Hemibagrus wyckioides TaxID=337641 RepID=A0A9D3NFK3_9TELE|nr:hypothetical protein KOW79_016221 [Hemibagrus wyckioides]